MVRKFFCSESRFSKMGIAVLKKLLNEAKSTKDVITIEATVTTGFEALASDECKIVCKTQFITRSKGRIFFNINKELYPNVLKMRSIDNIFLVTEAFDELQLTNVKDVDLSIVKNLADQVNWSKSVAEWAHIVDYKGVQFPQCANKSPDEPLDEGVPACQTCLQNRTGNGQASNEAVFQTPPLPDKEEFQTPIAFDCIAPESTDKNVEVFQTPADNCVEEECCQKEENPTHAPDKIDLAVTSSPNEYLAVKLTSDTDDEAFHSAEEDLQAGVLEGGTLTAASVAPLTIAKDSESELFAAPLNAPKSLPLDCEDKKSNGRVRNESASSASSTADRSGLQEANHKKKKGNWERRKEKRLEAKRNRQSVEKDSDAPKPAACPDVNSESSSDVNEPNNLKNELSTDEGNKPDIGNKPEEKKKNYWQRRRDAKEKKAAEARAKKPPRKAYIDDGIMKFRVTCYRNGPKHSFDSNEAAGHFGGIINDKFHWTVDLTRHDINVVLVIEDKAAYVSLALTKQSLHRRNIKNFGPTTLRATLCYSLMRFAEPLPGDIVIDPMCGGASISIEGALAFPGTYHLCGDVNEKCVERIKDNVAYNSQEKPLFVDGFMWSVRRLPLRDQSVDVVVTDLPFGLRVGKQRDNTGLYTAALHELARVVRTVGRASLLTYDRTAMIRALQRSRHLWREIQCQMVNQVLDLAFDSVGVRLAAAEGNGHVQVWDARKGSELQFCLSGHSCEVSKVCFSPGGGQLLTASSDGTARLWSAKDGRQLQILGGHSDEVFSCSFSYSGESILTASKDKTCRLWKRQPLIEDE